jgi:two-component system sensor histidine kinase and response regulator WspE
MVDTLRELKGRQSRLIEALDALGEHVGRDREEARASVDDLLARLRTQASACAQGLLEKVEEIEDFARAGEDLSGRLHHEVLASRMRPLADGLRGFPRMVRDVSRKLGKGVEFQVVGENTGVDRDILDKLEAPLNHLIRNAMDHGIEAPEERVAAGKRPSGTIQLEARHRAGMLQITLADDGRGIDPQRLREKIVARGLAGAAMAAQLSEAELLEFLFLPGFSTRENVTEMSGRGVGLDVVQTMVRAVGGVVRIATQPGRGTRFILQLPITRSVIRALLVRIAGEPYAFPLSRIDRIVRLAEDDLRVLEGRRHFTMDDQPVGLIEAAQVFELPPLPRAGAGNSDGDGHDGGELPVVVVSDRSHRFGLVVDAFLGERDLEVRPLDARLGKVPDISSASVLEDGVPVLIFDVEDLVRSIDNLLGGHRLRSIAALEGASGSSSTSRGPKRVLVVDDSITVRELERQLLEARGYAVDVAVDGIDGWNAVRAGHYQLVISDVDMPRMDGIALVRSIKGDARLGSIPVIIVSYKEREEDRMRGLDAGADAYLTKSSFQDQTLLDTVADLIGEPLG